MKNISNKEEKISFIVFSGTGCIILSPTRELALQTFELVKKLTSDTDLTYALIVGGENKSKEIKVLLKGNYSTNNIYIHIYIESM